MGRFSEPFEACLEVEAGGKRARGQPEIVSTRALGARQEVSRGREGLRGGDRCHGPGRWRKGSRSIGYDRISMVSKGVLKAF